jgi:hypothetical protein
MGFFDDSHKKEDTRLEQILHTFKDKDKQAITALFSQQALLEDEDFSENLDNLFDYVQGSIQSWQSAGAYGEFEERSDSAHKREVDSTYVFTTDEQEYEVAIYEYTIDIANPDNVGIYSLCIINSKDNQNPDFVYWGNGEAGINIGWNYPVDQ